MIEYGAGRQVLCTWRSGRSQVAILVPDQKRFLKNVCSCHCLERLVRCPPKRCADSHGGDLSVAGLAGVGLTHYLILLGQPRIEHPAEVHIAGMAARTDDHTLLCLDAYGFVLAHCRDSKNPARGTGLPDNAC